MSEALLANTKLNLENQARGTASDRKELFEGDKPSEASGQILWRFEIDFVI